MRMTNTEKKQLKIYVAIAFGVTYIMGLFLWYGYETGKALSVFPNAQMLYPAAGVMLFLLLTRKKEEVPGRFFIAYLVITGLMIVCAGGSAFVDEKSGMQLYALSQLVLICGSVICGILLLTEKKEKRIACGLRGKNGGKSTLCIVLFLLIYTLRMVFISALGGQLKEFGRIFQDPMTWIVMVNIAINFFLSYLAFFGEEYGWRYYLQPVLQKRYGKRNGVIVLGIVWGFWHLPLDFFYYTSPDMGLPMLASQIVTCVTLGIFFAYAYMKTENIWVPVILHFLNNNLIMVFSGNYTESVLEDQVVTWGSVVFSFIINMLIFGGFLFTKEFKTNRGDSYAAFAANERSAEESAEQHAEQHSEQHAEQGAGSERK